MRIHYPEHTREEVISRIRSSVPKLRPHLPMRLVALFGSYAKGRHTAASDVDILIIYDDPKREDTHKLVIDTIDIPRLEPHIYTTSEYDKMKDSTLSREVTRRGVIIWARDRKQQAKKSH